MVAAVLFIRGLKGLTHPRTAVRGNLTGSLAMLIAVLATLWGGGVVSWTWIIAGLLIGSVVGTVMALRVPMTSMPELVAVFNGFGGGASALVAGAELIMVLAAVEADPAARAALTLPFSIATVASGLIGAVTLTGSLIAFGKLAEFKITLGGKKYWMSSSLLLPGRHFINSTVALTALLLCILLIRDPSAAHWYWVLLAVAGVLGVLITIPIGGADMPVVIALLNSYSGLAACATGFVINNNVLIIAGSLVGASGLILTKIMCKAMNRSLVNVIFATMGPTSSTPSADDIYEGKVKSTSSEEVAMLLEDAQRVVIVPGYGMAVAQAQHQVRELASLLEQRGCQVRYAIHPVAGRMPGHMNVLLAEADVPYEQLVEMDDINPAFPRTDVALVLGANDVTNPDARENPSSPIYGMPILEVDRARTVMVCKRSMNPGFAGIDNPLYYLPNTMMLFGDAKGMVEGVI
ncbi:MAG: NAD(P)(+) transhydrogenase (Re/Si-specific) subunit beta, partial [Planctomycetota bacterium]|nr:NAD(P)(+) transhydrogenase (Re/Si-specific) subunit beta [Planctomycetota bacterium]